MNAQPPSTMTSTKRKAIGREMASHEGPVVPYEKVLQIVNRHHSTPREVANFLGEMGFTVTGAPDPRPASLNLDRMAAPAPVQKRTDQDPIKKPKSSVPPEIVASILRGGIYKVLDDDPQADPATVFVVTTLDKFQRERDAIRKIIQESQG